MPRVTSLGSLSVPAEHALLVPFGGFAQQIGLIQALDRLPITMKTMDRSPDDKVVELLIHLLAGGVIALKTELQQVTAPYRHRLLRDLVPSFLVVDGDLTGLVVSDQAETYEGADYGSMGELGTVGKG